MAPVINPPSPLYGIDTVKPSGSVVVVEGRENRNVLAENTGWNVVSHDPDVNVFNWSALAGRDVIVWPTYSKDRAAVLLGLDVCGKLHGVAAEVRRVDLTRWSNDGKVPPTLRDGWGAIDALASPGISRDLAAFIGHMAPKTAASMSVPVERVMLHLSRSRRLARFLALFPIGPCRRLPLPMLNRQNGIPKIRLRAPIRCRARSMPSMLRACRNALHTMSISVKCLLIWTTPGRAQMPNGRRRQGRQWKKARQGSPAIPARHWPKLGLTRWPT
ncbi:hypothetical protein ACCT08_05975 [Rhizobium johnstonii]|uniref:hypothetical protein n=1 Tax=Rhizobium johnstonii TaxID=3019933 RepID=UPI003F9E1B6D